MAARRCFIAGEATTPEACLGMIVRARMFRKRRGHPPVRGACPRVVNVQLGEGAERSGRTKPKRSEGSAEVEGEEAKKKRGAKEDPQATEAKPKEGEGKRRRLQVKRSEEEAQAKKGKVRDTATPSGFWSSSVGVSERGGSYRRSVSGDRSPETPEESAGDVPTVGRGAFTTEFPVVSSAIVATARRRPRSGGRVT